MRLEEVERRLVDMQRSMPHKTENDAKNFIALEVALIMIEKYRKDHGDDFSD